MDKRIFLLRYWFVILYFVILNIIIFPDEWKKIIKDDLNSDGKNEIINRDIVRISNKLSLKLNRSRLYKGNVVYPCVGTIGNAVVINEDDRYHIQQNIAKISPLFEYIDSEYLAYYRKYRWCELKCLQRLCL